MSPKHSQALEKLDGQKEVYSGEKSDNDLNRDNGARFKTI